MYNVTFKVNHEAKIDGGEAKGKTRQFKAGQTIQVEEISVAVDEVYFDVRVGNSTVTYYGIPLIVVDTDCPSVENCRP